MLASLIPSHFNQVNNTSMLDFSWRVFAQNVTLRSLFTISVEWKRIFAAVREPRQFQEVFGFTTQKERKKVETHANYPL